MFNPQIILIALLAMLASTGLGFYTGQNWANTSHEAQRAKDNDAYQQQLTKQLAHANELSDRLAKAEGRITTKTIEVIKYVDRYTTGRDCLSSAATGLLNNSIYGLHEAETSHTPAAENAGTPSSTDRDIYIWAAESIASYATCAQRLNTLVDYIDGVSK